MIFNFRNWLRQVSVRLSYGSRSVSRRASGFSPGFAMPACVAFEQLETRILLSAAANSMQSALGNAPALVATGAVAIGTGDSNAAGEQAVFIDSRVPDLQGLMAGVRPGDRVFILDPARDGVQQIAADLAANNLHNLSAIDVVGHGGQGEIQLGSLLVTDADLAGHAAAFAQLGASLAPGGDVAIYGCNVAAGASGQTFVQDLSHFTGADVAAASHLVGAAELGGSWNLDYSTGSVEAQNPFAAVALAGFDHTLDFSYNVEQGGTVDISFASLQAGRSDLASDDRMNVLFASAPGTTNGTISRVTNGSPILWGSSTDFEPDTANNTTNRIFLSESLRYTNSSGAVGTVESIPVKFSDGFTFTAQENINITVIAAGSVPVINTQPQSQSVAVGHTATLTVGATGSGTLSYQWYQGSSPTGNLLSGETSSSFTTPALGVAAQYFYFVQVSNANGSVYSDTATVQAATNNPSTTTASSAEGVAGQNVSLSATVSDPGAVGLLSEGTVTFSVFQGATQIGTPVSGTVSSQNASANFSIPAGTAAGLYTIHADYHDAAGNFTDSHDYSQSLTVDTPPGISSGTPPATATVGTAYSYTLTATGGPVPTRSASGLPADGWLTFNPSTGVLSGTPGLSDEGTTGTITLTASNGISPDATLNFTITVNGPPTIGSGAPPTTSTVGTGYTYTFSATGTPTPTLSASGLPADGWLKFNAGTGVLSGTPAVTDEGTTGTITLKASNGHSPDATLSFTITVSGPPTINSGAPPTIATVGTAYTYTLSATGTPGSTLSATGLPADNWLTFNPATGVLSGTPAVGDVGTTGTITLKASNGHTPNATLSFTIDVGTPPGINSGTPPATATVGTAYSYTLTATGTPDSTLSASGLPADGWLTFDAGTGILSGTPGVADEGTTGTITLKASNGHAPDATLSFSIVVSGPPTINSNAPPATATVGTAYSYTLTATSTPTSTLSASGLPADSWLTFDPATGILSGTPAVIDEGTTGTITLTASNGFVPDATLNFTITVNGPPTINSGAPPATATVGTAYSYKLTATGTPTSTLSASGLPADGWLTFDAGTGILSGTPGVTDEGPTGTITLKASNGYAPDATLSFTIAVSGPPTINSGAPPATATVGTAYNYTVHAIGVPGSTLSASGLPADGWLGFNPGTGLLSGTPGIADEGTTGTITLRASNGFSPDSTLSFTITINGPPTINSGAPPATATVGTAYSYKLTAAGTPTSTLSASGLPADGWLTFDPGTGILSGTPGVLDEGPTGTITLKASNGYAPDSTLSFTIAVSGPPTINSGTPPATATVGTAYSYTLSAVGVPGSTLSASGLPADGWLSFNPGTGVLSGTPAVIDEGITGTITLRASNGFSPDATRSFTITVSGPPTINSGTPPAIAVVGTLYSYTLTAIGTPGSTLSASGLPADGWLTFNPATGVLSGTPGVADASTTSTITLTAANGFAPNASRTFSLLVDQPPAFNSANHTKIPVQLAGSFTVTATGYPAPTVTESKTDVLPAGVTFDSSTGILGGTPAAGTIGTYLLHFTASNGVSPDATETFTLKITPQFPFAGEYAVSTGSGSPTLASIVSAGSQYILIGSTVAAATVATQTQLQIGATTATYGNSQITFGPTGPFATQLWTKLDLPTNYTTARGAATQVNTSGNSITFVNENGTPSPAIWLNPTQLSAFGLTVTVGSGKLTFSDGTVWYENVSLPGTLDGTGTTSISASPSHLTVVDYTNLAGTPVHLIETGTSHVVFVDGLGRMSLGVFSSPTQATADLYPNDTATVIGGVILWQDGGLWIQATSPSPQITITDYTNPNDVTTHLIRNGTPNFAISDGLGRLSLGTFFNDTQALTTLYPKDVATFTATTVTWQDGFVWTKTSSPPITTTIIDSTGGLSHVQLLSATVLLGLDGPFRGVTGTRLNGKINWSNGQVWDDFDINGLDAFFEMGTVYP